ncbi:unnamed protein product [Closterium sp. Yama58-4]|nr:unnamed protein product [Closterium sp. Yama58-4]
MAVSRVQFALLFAFLMAIVTAALADKSGMNHLSSTLMGRYEIPHNDSKLGRKTVGDRRGIGFMRLKIYKDDRGPIGMNYEVIAVGLEGYAAPIKTQIHAAQKGWNGERVIDLPCRYLPQKQQGRRTLWRCEGSLGMHDIRLWDELRSALVAIVERPTSFYGNILTKRYPDGAVRGQFKKA